MDVLKVVDELGRVAATNGQANNRHETESVATTSPSTSVAVVIRGCGWHAATFWVVISPEIPAPPLHASPQPEVPPAAAPSQPSFDLGIGFNLTPHMHPATPSYPPTSSNAPTLPMDLPHIEPITMIPTLDLYIC